MTLACEYTDSFAGEANYSWVRRAEVTVPADASDRSIVIAGKAALGLTGARCQTTNHGDSWELRPVGYCTVAFIVPVP
jgi:hypothetical protein